jgi:hypothetical protein
LACFHMLLVDFTSPLSRNLCTLLNLCKHCFTVHMNVWHRQPLWCSTSGTGQKNA